MKEVDNQELSRILKTEQNRKSTEELTVYKTLKSKNTLFGQCLTFDSSTKFLNFWEELPGLLGGDHFIFRGVKESSYRLFSKAQRNYQNNFKHFLYDEPNYHDLIRQMIDNAKCTYNGLLPKYFKSFGYPINDISILSFLQHYGAPTPLLDWTNSFDIALYFGIASLSDVEIEKHYLQPARNIDGYFSVYILNTNLMKIYTSDFKKLNKRSRKTNTYDTLIKKGLAYISEEYHNEKPQFILDNNLNIISQNGVFLYNSNPKLPLEEIVYRKSFLYYSIARSIRGEKDTLRSPLICLNINKGIAKHIKNALIKKEITNYSVFPNPQDLANSSVPIMLS